MIVSHNLADIFFPTHTHTWEGAAPDRGEGVGKKNSWRCEGERKSVALENVSYEIVSERQWRHWNIDVPMNLLLLLRTRP